MSEDRPHAVRHYTMRNDRSWPVADSRGGPLPTQSRRRALRMFNQTPPNGPVAAPAVRRCMLDLSAHLQTSAKRIQSGRGAINGS